jgi:hypothetical protein
MSKIDYKYDNYLYSRSLLSVGVVMVLFSLVILFPTDIYALTQTTQGTPQGSNHAGDQQRDFENRTNSANFLNINSNQANSPLIMTTDKSVYSPGETVNVTITNTGIEPLTFPNAALGLTISNVATNQTYPIFSAQMITTLDGNESRSVTWGPISLNRSEVPPGDYVASLTSGGSTEDVIFTISG